MWGGQPLERNVPASLPPATLATDDWRLAVSSSFLLDATNYPYSPLWGGVCHALRLMNPVKPYGFSQSPDTVGFTFFSPFHI